MEESGSHPYRYKLKERMPKIAGVQYMYRSEAKRNTLLSRRVEFIPELAG